MTSPVDTSVLDLGGLAALKRDARAQDPNAVREVAKQFESIFAKMVLSSMRQASFGDSLFGSDQQQFYQGMFDDQLAVELTKGRGLGLADMLVQQLTRAGLVPSDKKDSVLSGASERAEIQPSTPFEAARGARNGNGGAEIEGLPLEAARGAQKSRSSDPAAPGTASPPATSRTLSPEEFVGALWPCAEEAGKELGVDPRHLIAQAALETGWGKSLPCDANGATSFNFFGIKATGSWKGDTVSVRTLEFEGGLPVPKQARFRSYESAEASFRDYVDVLRNNPRYAAALNTGSDTHAFAKALQQGGYATDPAYASKISSIAQNLPSWKPELKSGASAPMTVTDSRVQRP